MPLLTVPVARALVADLLDAMQPADAMIVLEQLRRRYAPAAAVVVVPDPRRAPRVGEGATIT